jgi:feruloyl esterase
VNGTANFSFSTVRDYFRGIVYNDSNWSDYDLTIAEVEHAVRPNVGLTNTGMKDAHLGDFKEAGGQIISYHGRVDPVVPSELSEWYFNGAGKNINAAFDGMHDFYRLFFIPGMSHCRLGPGVWSIGQAYPLNRNQLDADHVAILALQKWVDQGESPEELIGTKYVDDDVNLGIVAQRSK